MSINVFGCSTFSFIKSDQRRSAADETNFRALLRGRRRFGRRSNRVSVIGGLGELENFHAGFAASRFAALPEWRLRCWDTLRNGKYCRS